ncbi:ADOP family duplicated permease [uncultured Paludibaculum sp.]|uniref:ADOP family duplicated permease n=1 Tax=uncultured Paludibaculum sp. TaxID=1765020 RepID=UPI002AAABF59|nr:ADOP family duplicated permease [uncultured Paludibaculum sp.]
MIVRRLQYWIHRRRRAAALREEIELHVEEKAEELRDAGLSERDAWAQARRLFGNPLIRQEESREIWIARYWSEFWQDLRYGVRTLAAKPGFTLAAVLALVLGIGVNAFFFNVYNSLAWEPWAIRDPQSTVQVLQERHSGRWSGFSWPHFRYLQTNVRSLAGLAADSGINMRVTRGESIWDGEAGAVSGNFFDLLAPGFALGRGFLPATAEVVLSHDAWLTRFGGDPQILGASIELNRRRFQVAGVATPGFNGATINRTDMWVSAEWRDLLLAGEPRLDSDSTCCLSLVGRLNPGVSREAAEAEMSTLHAQYLESVRRPPGRLLLTEPSFLANPTRSSQTRPFFLIVAVASLLILALACANVANLQLARTVARRGEIALRLSLGASHARILRQLIVESLCISAMAGLASLAVSQWLPDWTFRQLAGPQDRLTFQFANDTRVLLFVVLATLIAALLSGLAPAVNAIRGAAAGHLRQGSHSRSSGRMRAMLLGAQVALSTILLAGTALMVRSIDRIRHVDIGLPQEKLLVMSTGFDASGLPPARARALLDSLMERTATLPGVESVSLASRIPFGERCGGSAEDPASHERIPVTMHEVSPNFFETLRVPILLGRGFTAGDSGRATVILSEAAARRFFPAGDAIGQTLSLARPSQVVGVVRDFGTADFGSEHDVYQVVESAGRCNNLLVIRHAGRAAALLAELPKQAYGLDRRFILFAVPYSSVVAKAHHAVDLAAAIAAVLGGLSLLLVCVGIYGVAAYGISQRTRELGIRVALGARPARILAMVLRQNLRTVTIGAGVGILGAMAFGRLLRSLLYGVSPSDPAALALTIATLLLMSTLAVWGPARRAAQIDPAITLRHE